MFVHVRRVVFWLKNDMYGWGCLVKLYTDIEFEIIYAAHTTSGQILIFFLLENFSLMIIFSIAKKKKTFWNYFWRAIYLYWLCSRAVYIMWCMLVYMVPIEHEIYIFYRFLMLELNVCGNDIILMTGVQLDYNFGWLFEILVRPRTFFSLLYVFRLFNVVW